MENELFNLTGKTSLVTGGSRGIGLAIAEGLARRGSDVVIIARDKEQLEAAKEKIQSDTGRKVWVFSFDLEKTEQIEVFFKTIVSEVKGVDVLVNCAGINNRGAAEDIGTGDWEQVMKVNLTAGFLLAQGFCRHLKTREKGGKIINIGSVLCVGARATTTPYAVSKGGLLMLTRSLAVEWAKYGINVNAIGPGYIATELTAELQADEDFDKWVVSRTPLGRWGQAKDITGAAIFLASSASDFVTGQILYVDGGWLAAL